MDNIYGIKNFIKGTEKNGFKSLVSLSSSKTIGTINDDDNNSIRKGIDYAMLTHNPHQKHIKNPPTVIGKK